MLQTIITLLCINIICVVITDMTDWPDTAKKALTFILTKGKITTDKYEAKLLTCSLCLTFWLSILYILLSGQISIPLICIAVISALFTRITYSLLLFILDMINSLINKLNKLL